MAPKFVIVGGSTKDCGTLIDVGMSSNIDVQMYGHEAERVGTMFRQRDPASFAQQIGLPADTPHDQVIGLYRDLVNLKDRSPAGVRGVVGRWLPAVLKGGVDAVQVTAAILEIIDQI